MLYRCAHLPIAKHGMTVVLGIYSVLMSFTSAPAALRSAGTPVIVLVPRNFPRAISVAVRLNTKRNSPPTLLRWYNRRNGTRSKHPTSRCWQPAKNHDFREGRKFYVQTFRTPDFIDCSYLRIIRSRSVMIRGPRLKPLPAVDAAFTENAPAGITDPATSTDEQNNIEVYRALESGCRVHPLNFVRARLFRFRRTAGRFGFRFDP